ncbi:YncE family protein [Adlercreutzia sp.]|uniref:YncE family protein n=1 Tax=Adlercreutzia sp. TaxID=1872387 RepID=UPI003AB4D9DB
MITRRNFVVLAGIGAMGLLNTAGCAAPAEEPPRDVSGEQEPLEEPSPIPQKEPVASSEPFSGEIIPGMLCVAEYATNTLAVVDARAGEVAGRIPVGRNPASVLAVGDTVFVGCTGAGEVTAVPMASPTAAAPIPVGHQILGLCCDEARGLIYAGDYFANSVHVIDVALQSLVGTMELSALGFSGRTDPPDCCRIDPGTGRRTVALALAPEGNLLYCANYGTFDVARVDLATGEEIEAFDGVVGPRQILVSADGAQLLLAGVGGEGEQQVSDLYVLDRSSGKRVQEVPVGQSVAGVAQASDGLAVWAIARDDGELVAFDADWNETGRLSLGVGIDTLVLAPDEKTLLVGNSIGGQVHVVDAPSLALLNTIEGLASPKGIAVIA